jgi:hypothetical protein
MGQTALWGRRLGGRSRGRGYVGRSGGDDRDTSGWRALGAGDGAGGSLHDEKGQRKSLSGQALGILGSGRLLMGQAGLGIRVDSEEGKPRAGARLGEYTGEKGGNQIVISRGAAGC